MSIADLGNSTSLGELNDKLLGVWSFSRSECITWMIVLCAVSVSIVTLNGLSVIVFLRERSLRKRHMYLVITWQFANLLAGGFSPFILFAYLITPCLKWEIFLWFPIGNLATILSVWQCSLSCLPLQILLLFRWSVFTQRFVHLSIVSEKENLWSSYCRRLVFSGILLAVDFLILSSSVQLPIEFHMYSFLFCCLLIILCFLRFYRC